ncbi:MAG: OmpA family protein [Alphaproteobacteria bacterium]|nr:OmpA family protein [Alphaproteobacteria bacterium]
MKTNMKVRVLFAAPFLLGGLAACNGTPANGYIPGSVYQLEQLNKTPATGSPFTQALATNYRVFAQDEKDEYDWFGQKIFATKGLLAAAGKAPPPEELGEWKVSDPVAANDLKMARSRLVTMLGGSAPSQYPVWSAAAQTNFDCWLHEQYEGWEFDKIALCRKDFMKAMDNINAPPKAAQAQPAPAPAKASPPPVPYLVFFDFDKTELLPEARQIIANAAKAIGEGKVIRIRVVGYTDTSGSNDYNNRLSMRRADAVKQELVRDGIAANSIGVDGKGEGDLLMQTPDGVREPQNRRASIELIKQ